MKQVLKNYELCLTTIGPVFIGNGKELNKKEYLFLNDKKIAVMNIEKLYGRIRTKGLSMEFERYILGKGNETLKQWMMKNRVAVQDVKDCIDYILESGDLAVERGQRLQIMQCIKDAYGSPYIPGSSVKGMLRTILLGADLLANPGKYERDKEKFTADLWAFSGNRRRLLSGNITGMENRRYHTLGKTDQMRDAVNDELAGLIVGDSDPLDIGCLVPCQKVECHPDGHEKKLNLLRECIRPGTEIRLPLTIDQSLCKIDEKGLEQAIRLFGQQYYENFSSRFQASDRPRGQEVYLGGGCGFVSKTIIYPMFQKKEGVRITKTIFEKTGVPRVHKHDRDIQLGVSPHILKCTRYRGKLMQMGLCSLKITPMDAVSRAPHK